MEMSIYIIQCWISRRYLGFSTLVTKNLCLLLKIQFTKNKRDTWYDATCVYTWTTCSVCRLHIHSYNVSHFFKNSRKNWKMFLHCTACILKSLLRIPNHCLAGRVLCIFLPTWAVWINTCKQRGVSLITTITV